MAKELEVIELPSVDKLFRFSSDKGKTETTVMLPTDDILESPDYPYKIRDDDEMKELIESIAENGVRLPVIARRTEDGKYEMVSGRRRQYACQRLGIKEIPTIIKELTRDEAIIFMVDSNIQRETILPSEKAFAYKIKLEALKRQGKRNDLTSCQVGTKLRTDKEIAKNSEDSARQIQRYIRLTELIKEILDLVDNKTIAFNPAVEISFLTKDEQYVLLDCMKMYEATPSQAQAIRLKKLSQEGSLTADKIEEIISEEKPNQKDTGSYKIHYEKFEKYLPRDVATVDEVENYLLKLAQDDYNRKRQKQLSR